MSDDDEAPCEQSIEISPGSAVAHAARLLRNAEMVTDPALMERLVQMADSWISIAHVLQHDD